MSYNYKGISNHPEERQRLTYPYCYWNDAFTFAELDEISKISSTNLSPSAIFGTEEIGIIDTTTRISHNSFIFPNNQTHWIFEKLNQVIEICNNKWYNFDLNGYDRYQYTEYHGNEKGRYDWHVNIGYGNGWNGNETRKLSLSLLLNEPSEFEGGELQIGSEKHYESTNMQKGTVIVFPSFQMHRVTPVTKGIRKSLVVWVVGPKFK